MRLSSQKCMKALLRGVGCGTLTKDRTRQTRCVTRSHVLNQALVHDTLQGTSATKSFCTSCSLFRDTIYALSSGHGKCGVAVIRVSGSKSRDAIQLMTKSPVLPPARVAILRRLYYPGTSHGIDRGLLLWFPGPESFTGEDCCEFHVHGGPAVLEAMYRSLAGIDGLRHAEAGEFTKRAFEHGKIDLTAVEGLADLIHAETEAQRQQAFRQMEGALGKLYTQWRHKIVKCCANVEAFIDFSEEENIEAGVLEQVEEDIKELIKEIEDHLCDSRRGERLRSGVHIAIIGQPNVGKSSLLNLLCQRPAAIVSPIPGTTRDIVETALNYGGYPVVVSDTAGLRQTQDDVESEGVRRAIERARHADIRIIIVDLTQVDDLLLLTKSRNTESSSNQSLLKEFLSVHFRELNVLNQDVMCFGVNNHLQNDNGPESPPFPVKDCILLFNKIDLIPSDMRDRIVMSGEISGLVWCCISCKTEDGLDHFLDVLQSKVKDMCCDPQSANPSLTQARHRQHLTQCVEALHNYLPLQQTDIVLAANSLHEGSRHIGKITGKITSEEILDVVFRDFCIGK